MRIRIQGFTTKIGKNLQLKFTYPQASRTSKLQEKFSSLKREHLALQNMNFFHFCGSFCPSWIRIRIPNADPDSANQNECGSRSTILTPSWYLLFFEKCYELRLLDRSKFGPFLPIYLEVETCLKYWKGRLASCCRTEGWLPDWTMPWLSTWFAVKNPTRMIT
jgi:hypothetical protein